MDDVKVIKIIDDFFEDNLLINIQNHITTKLYYTPVYLPGSVEKNKHTHYANRFMLNNDKKFADVFITQAEKKFKIKIKELGAAVIDLRNLDHFKPHIDPEAVLNILIMLKGPEALTNGTVFYRGALKDCDHDKLDMSIGFKENRAILFPSNIVHSSHASDVPNLKRYTASIFIKNYEEE